MLVSIDSVCTFGDCCLKVIIKKKQRIITISSTIVDKNDRTTMLEKISDDSSHASNSAVHWYIFLVISKFARSLTLIFTYDLLKSYHIIWILFLTTFIAALTLTFIQTPFVPFPTGFLRSRTTLLRLLEYSIYLTVVRFLWLYGLMLCGPLRTILLFEHHDFVILACVHVLFSTSMSNHDYTSRIRGAVLFFCGIAVIFMLDTSQRTKEQVSIDLCNRSNELSRTISSVFILGF